MLAQDGQRAAARVRRDHGLQHGERHTWLVAQTRDDTRARVEMDRRARVRRERVVPAVIAPDALAKLAIGAGAAELLDPAMFVRGNALRGELAADPVGFLREDDTQPGATRREGGGDSPEASAADDKIRVLLAITGAGGGGVGPRARDPDMKRDGRAGGRDRGTGEETAPVHDPLCPSSRAGSMTIARNSASRPFTVIATTRN